MNMTSDDMTHENAEAATTINSRQHVQVGAATNLPSPSARAALQMRRQEGNEWMISLEKMVELILMSVGIPQPTVSICSDNIIIPL